MDRRCPCIGSGLLGLFVFLSAALCPVFPQETGIFPDPDYYRQYGLIPETSEPAESIEDLEILMEISPEVPEIHTEWTVSLLVNHPNPSEVSVVLPQLPAFLVLDHIRTTARFVRQGTAGMRGTEERWTAVGFSFVSGRGGPVSLAPFEVRVPGYRGYSPPLSVSIRGGEEEPVPLRAVWERSPASLRVGEAAEVRLRLITREKGNRHSVLYRPETPRNAIVEAIGIEEIRPGELVLRFRVIPLEGLVLAWLPSPLKYGDASLTIPGREFRVLPAIPPGGDTLVSEAAGIGETGGTADAGESPAPVFPDVSAAVFPLFRKGYEQALEEARGYWEHGWYAEAMVVLRLNERELTAGPVLAPLRRSAETALGIGFTEDEGWRPRRLFLVLTVSASFMLIFVLFFVFRTRSRQKVKTVTSSTSWGYTFAGILVITMIGAGLYGFFGGPGRRMQPGKGRAGIIREAGSFRVPEDGIIPDQVFREGEPVRIQSVTDAWLYVESFEGKAGWVPLDNVIPY